MRDRKSKSNKVKVVQTKPIVSDDRLGADEPVDEATTSDGKDSPGDAAPESLLEDHRVAVIEPNDEHNGEILINEGMQGYMKRSLTKPRKGTPI